MNCLENENVCSVDKENRLGFYRLHTIWRNDSFRINIASKDASWTGEMSAEDISKISEQLETDKESYLKECKDALTKDCGSEGISYSVENNSFIWRKIADHDTGMKLKLGSVRLEPCNFIDTIQNIVNVALTCNQNLHNQIRRLEEESEISKSNNTNLSKKFEELIKAKNIMESDLYTKFLELLNEKKRRIAELEVACSVSLKEDNPVPTKKARNIKSNSKSTVTTRSKKPTQVDDAYDVDTEDDEPGPASNTELPKRNFDRLKATCSVNASNSNEKSTANECSNAKKSKTIEYDSDSTVSDLSLTGTPILRAVLTLPKSPERSPPSENENVRVTRSSKNANKVYNNSQKETIDKDYNSLTLKDNDHLFEFESDTLKPTTKKILEKFF